MSCCTYSCTGVDTEKKIDTLKIDSLTYTKNIMKYIHTHSVHTFQLGFILLWIERIYSCVEDVDSDDNSEWFINARLSFNLLPVVRVQGTCWHMALCNTEIYAFVRNAKCHRISVSPWINQWHQSSDVPFLPLTPYSVATLIGTWTKRHSKFSTIRLDSRFFCDDFSYGTG